MMTADHDARYYERCMDKQLVLSCGKLSGLTLTASLEGSIKIPMP